MDSKIEFGRSISLVYHNYRKFVAERLSEVENFNPGWVPYLKTISRNQGIVSEELSKRLMVSKPAITKTIRQLEQEGLCVTKSHPKDKRSKQLFLTEKAILVLEKINPVLFSIQQEVLEDLNEEEVRMLDVVFRKILKNITK
ncbi:MAG: MarR family transcriptional regulator [Flavobacteriales bacterium]|nr:MarR family transcriptional regulator [Flavobacteriales bacterium]